ncbi:hypothetical protein [Mesorhizobium sp. CN2-181]|uniref:hypothetical protein n=1 Tax=Mesorhizobium yinganensis TaxID=3157707 RepID=UPI0032B83831
MGFRGWPSIKMAHIVCFVVLMLGILLQWEPSFAARFEEITIQRAEIEQLYKEKQALGSQKRRYLITCKIDTEGKPIRFKGGCHWASLIEAYVGKRKDDRLEIELTFDYGDPALIVAFLPAGTTFFQSFGRKAVYDLRDDCTFMRAPVGNRELNILHISERTADIQNCVVRAFLEFARIEVPKRLVEGGENYTDFALTFLSINASTLDETLEKTAAALKIEHILFQITPD